MVNIIKEELITTKEHELLISQCEKELKKKININKKHLIIGFISAIITFILFEALSWYVFGDIPTIRVFLRLIIFFSILYLIILKSYNFIIKRKKK